MEKYMLLFRMTEERTEINSQTSSPDLPQAELDKWNQWIGGIAAQGKLIGGSGLHLAGKVVKGSAHIVTDGPYIESKELVSGYLTVTAENIQEAIELSKGCPVFDTEGSVEIRQVRVF
jgi:hypothetical protein